jgi:hypothetical protein
METDARTDGICKTERAGCFDTAADVLDRSTRITHEPCAIVNVGEEATGEHFETRDDALAREGLDALLRSRIGNLHLQRALSKAEPQRLRHEGLHLRLEDHVVACYPQVDVTLADEGRYVGRWEEDAVL